MYFLPKAKKLCKIKNNGVKRVSYDIWKQKKIIPQQYQTLVTWKVMLEKPGSLAVQSLVLNYMSSRNYHDSSAAEHQQSSWSDEEDERYKHREGE